MKLLTHHTQETTDDGVRFRSHFILEMTSEERAKIQRYQPQAALDDFEIGPWHEMLDREGYAVLSATPTAGKEVSERMLTICRKIEDFFITVKKWDKEESHNYSLTGDEPFPFL